MDRQVLHKTRGIHSLGPGYAHNEGAFGICKKMGSIFWVIQHFEEEEKKMLIGRKLWIKENWKAYEQEMKDKWLEQLKENNPRKYQMVIKHMKKTQ